MDSILLITDSAEIIRECLPLLTEQGYDISVAANPDERQTMATDLLLCDLETEGLDLRTVSRYAFEDDVSLIAITPFEMVDRAITAMQMGAYGYVLKPVFPPELSLVVSRALRGKQLGLENEYLRQLLANPSDSRK